MPPRGPNKTLFKMGEISTQAFNQNVINFNNQNLYSILPNVGSLPDELNGGQATIKSNDEELSFSYNNDISSEQEKNVDLRPEILLLTKFNPLYDDDGNLTKHGELLNSYINNLKILEANIKEEVIQSIGEEELKQRNKKFKDKVFSLKKDLLNLQSFIKGIESFYKTLFLSENKFLFKPINFFQRLNPNIKNGLLKAYEQAGTADESYNLYSALSATDRFINVDSFSSSKVLLTSINELANCIESLPYNAYKIPEIENIKKLPAWNTPQHNLSYVLPDMGKDIKRINYISLTNNDTIPFEITDDYSRFEYLDLTQPEIAISKSTSQNDLLKHCKNIFTVVLKDLDRQQKFLKLYGEKKSYLDRSVELRDFIGYYKNSTSLIDSAKKPTFTGQKLSDLVFFRNVKNPTQRVLLLENTDTITLPEDVITGKKYVFAKDFIEKLFETKNEKDFTLDTSKIKDVKSIIDFLVSKSYEQFIDLGTVYYDDDTNPLLFLIDLRYKFLKNRSETNDDIIFNPKTPKKVRPGLKASDTVATTIKKGGGYEYVDKDSQPFDENSLIAIFTGKGLTSKSKYTIINLFYNYIYARAVNSNDLVFSNPETVAIKIAKQFTVLPNNVTTEDEFLNVFEHPINGANVSSGKKVQFIRATHESFINSISAQLQNSYFIKTLVDYFKKFINLGIDGLLPAFFISIHTYISEVSGYSILCNNSVQFGGTGTPGGEKVFIQFSLNDKEENLRPRIVGMFNDVSTDMVTIANLTFAVINTLQVLKQHFDSYYNLLELSEKSYLNSILAYLDNDKRKLSALFEEIQLLRALSSIDDVHQSYNGPSSENVDQQNLFIKSEENFPQSSEIVSLINSFFKSKEYMTEKGNNKQIISIGAPYGLFKNLYQRLDKKNIVNSNQNDLFVVSLYKMDLLNPYLIYKPKRFLFEASRFPVRIYSEYKKIGQTDYEFLPTRNFDLFSDQNFSIAGNIGANIEKCFGSKYDDISWWSIASSEACKEEILVNHGTSFILENYLKLTTGLNVNELTFNLNFSVLPLLALNASLSTDQEAKYISNLLHPKKFDKVFNIIFDPEFEIDYDETINGIKSNVIKQNVADKLNNKYLFTKYGNATYIDADKSADDVSMNSYFATIETYAEAGPIFVEENVYDASINLGFNPNKPDENIDALPSPSESSNDFVFTNSGIFEKFIGSSNESGYTRFLAPDYKSLIKYLGNWTLGNKK